MIPAGQRNTLVIFEQDMGSTETPAGQPIVAWQTFCERRCKLAELGGRELFVSRQDWPEVTTDITLLADAETSRITAKMRARYQDRFGNEHILNLLSSPLDPDGRGAEYVLKCRREGDA